MMHMLILLTFVVVSIVDARHSVSLCEFVQESLQVPCEDDHRAVTDDGYVLQLVRLPHPGAPVVFFQHG